MIDFHSKILFIGFGAVARCALPVFLRHFRVVPASITVLDFEDRSKVLQPWTAQGLRFVRRAAEPAAEDQPAWVAQGHWSEASPPVSPRAWAESSPRRRQRPRRHGPFDPAQLWRAAG